MKQFGCMVISFFALDLIFIESIIPPERWYLISCLKPTLLLKLSSFSSSLPVLPWRKGNQLKLLIPHKIEFFTKRAPVALLFKLEDEEPNVIIGISYQCEVETGGRENRCYIYVCVCINSMVPFNEYTDSYF